MAATGAGATIAARAPAGPAVNVWDMPTGRKARRIDYREYRLRRPPQGYEWRRSNNRFVLVRISTGYIMSVIIFNGR